MSLADHGYLVYSEDGSMAWMGHSSINRDSRLGTVFEENELTCIVTLRRGWSFMTLTLIRAELLRRDP